MSHEYNTRYLESAQELYESSIADGDTKTAQAVLADLRENGFTKEAETLAEKNKSLFDTQMDVITKGLR